MRRPQKAFSIVTIFLAIFLLSFSMAGLNYAYPFGADQPDFPDIYIDAGCDQPDFPDIYIDAGCSGTKVGSQANPYDDLSDINWTTGGDNSIFDYLAGSPSASPTIHLKKGDTWREQVTVGCSGTATYPIILTSYGSGADPKILGSIAKNNVGDWTAELGWKANGDIWSDNFDDNDLTGYDSTVGGVVNQNERLEVTIDCSGGSSADYVKEGFVAATEVYASFAVYVNSLDTWVNGDYIEFFNLEDGGVGKTAIGIYNNAGTTHIRSYYVDDAAATQWHNHATVIGTGQWYKFFVRWKAATGPGANDGIWEVWVDGTRLVNVVNADTDTIQPDSFGFGNAYADNGTVATIYGDDLDVGSGETTIIYHATNATEVRNAVFDSEASYASRVVDKGLLKAQGELWWDSTNTRIYLYSAANPATQYSGSVELCEYSTLINVNSKDYITFDGLDLRYGSLSAIFLDLTGGHIIIQNCTIKYFGYIRTGSAYSGAALYSVDLASFTFDNNTVSYVWRGIYHADDDGGCVATITNNDFSYNVFSGAQTGLIAFGGSTSVKIDYVGSEISGNTIHHFEDTGITLSHSSTFIIENNTVHTSTDQTANDQIGISCPATNNGWHIIRYNFIYNVKGEPGSWTGGVGISSRSGQYMDIYYNTIHDCTKGICDFVKTAGGDNDNNEYYNNTIEGCSQYGMRIHDGINGNVKTLTIQNNILDGPSDDILVNDYITVTGGYNCLMNDASVGVGVGSTYNGSANDLYSTDPSFRDATNDDFHLLMASPCIDAGTDVSLTTDYEGLQIRHAPDIGAHENQTNVLFRPEALFLYIMFLGILSYRRHKK